MNVPCLMFDGVRVDVEQPQKLLCYAIETLESPASTQAEKLEALKDLKQVASFLFQFR